MLFVSIGGLIFQISQNASNNNTSSSKTSKVADKDDDDSDLKSDSKGDSTDVNDYIDKNAKFDWNESKVQKSESR